MKNVSRILQIFLVLVYLMPVTSRGQEPKQPPSEPTEEIATPDPVVDSDTQLVRPDKVSYVSGLQVDGNLVGRIRLDDGKGKPIPVIAHLAFFQGGKLIDASRTGPAGYFQLTRLITGKYLVVALSRYGEVTFEVEVRPFDQSAAMEDLLLDVILLPNVDLELIEQMLLDEPCALCGETCGGVCGGGRGEFPWGLLGLAGLAGLGGSCDKPDRPVATPFKPNGHE